MTWYFYCMRKNNASTKNTNKSTNGSLIIGQLCMKAKCNSYGSFGEKEKRKVDLGSEHYTMS